MQWPLCISPASSSYRSSGVGVAQLVEHWIVAPVVVGSNPIAHLPTPKKSQQNQWVYLKVFVDRWA